MFIHIIPQHAVEVHTRMKYTFPLNFDYVRLPNVIRYLYTLKLVYNFNDYNRVCLFSSLAEFKYCLNILLVVDASVQKNFYFGERVTFSDRL